MIILCKCSQAVVWRCSVKMMFLKILQNSQEKHLSGSFFLTLKDPFISEICIEIKIELNFYFHTSLWCLKRFYEGLEGLHKTF